MPKRKENKSARIVFKIVRFLLLTLVVALGYQLTVSQYGFLNMMELRSQIDDLKAEELEYSVRLVDMEQRKLRLETDSLLIEKLARQKYRLSKPGETVRDY